MFSVRLGELLTDDEVVKLKGVSAAELTDRIEELLTDPDYAVSIGTGGQRGAARLFDLDRSVGTLLGVYRAATDRTERPDLSALTASSSDAR
jgi:hypothetical protein